MVSSTRARAYSGSEPVALVSLAENHRVEKIDAGCRRDVAYDRALWHAANASREPMFAWV
jgi:hypothetical protein